MSGSLNDRKNTNKPPGWYKKMRRQKERNRANRAVREEAEADDGPNLVVRKRDDSWDWN